MICMPISHSASYHAYEKASKEVHDREKTQYLASAAWFQALCYFLGVCATITLIWCGIELGKLIG